MNQTSSTAGAARSRSRSAFSAVRPAGRPETVSWADFDDVVLLSERGDPIGTAPRRHVHDENTPLHLAFSVHLFNSGGQTLLTRRALTKVAWPGVWTNSCCGHPRPGEEVTEAVRRRVQQELGLDVEGLRVVLPDFRYRAVDDSGVVENEICPVYVGFVGDDGIDADPGEVAAYDWVHWGSLVAVARMTPGLLSPWAALQIPRVAERVDLRASTGGDRRAKAQSPTAGPARVQVAGATSFIERSASPKPPATPQGATVGVVAGASTDPARESPVASIPSFRAGVHFRTGPRRRG